MSADPAVWDAERVARWLRLSEGLERQLAPVSDLLFDAAALAPGEAVLDVGCGHGPTTRVAARAVGPGGAVTGVDLAQGMLDAAAGIDAGPDAAPLTWIAADVVTWEPPAARFDVVLSRFGVMFFDDPAAAFANLAAAARPGGRLAIATWGRRDEAEIFDLPYQVSRRVALDAGETPPEVPLDGGPYSLSDPDRLRALLADAGWSEVAVARHDLVLPYAGGVAPEAAAAEALVLGPARYVVDALPHLRDQVVHALAGAFASHLDADGHVALGGRVLVTTAHRSG